MEQNATYVNVLVTALKKKLSILEKMEQSILEQERILKQKKISIDEVNENEKEQEELLIELDKADQGFENVYNRVREEFAVNKYQYETEIKTMQGYIKKITDLTVKIQAQQIRNRQLMEVFFYTKKREVQKFHYNKRTTAQYHSHMANTNSGEAVFLDSKK